MYDDIRRKESVENYYGSVDKSGESDIIEAGKEETTENNMFLNVFHTYDDPMREVMGSAYENNREELNSIIEELKKIGIEVIISDDNESIEYQPGNKFSGGTPGQIKIAKASSLSACMRERQHAIDDYNSGWKGRYILSLDPHEHYNWEVRAYGVEIDIAKSLGRSDMVERLEKLLEEERRKIFDEA